MIDLPSPPADPGPDSVAVLRASWFTAVIVLAVYTFRAAPTTYLLDSSELVATTFGLGVSHPPGHPAFHLSTYALTLFPLGSVAFRIHLASALAAAVTLGLLPYACWGAGWLRDRSGLAGACAIAIAIAFTPAFAQQSIRAEVYALNALMMAAATVVATRAGQDRRVSRTVALAVILGLGLLNHHYLTVFAFPAFAWVTIGGAGAGRARRVLAGCAAGAAMLVGYAYLPARAARRPWGSWGWPDSVSDIWWTISAEAFQKTATRATAMDPVAGLTNVVGILMESLTVVGFLLAAGGLIVLWIRDRRFAGFATLAIAGNLATQILFDFDPLNPDALGYFMPTYWWLGLGLAYFVSQVELPGRLHTRTGTVRVAVGLVLMVGTSLAARTSGRAVDLARSWDSELLRDEAFNGIAPGGAWLTAYYETGFNSWYGTEVEGRRPDVTHLHQAFFTYPFYREMVEWTYPEVAGWIGDDGMLDVSALTEAAGRTDVRIEPETLVSAEIAARCIPMRLYLRLMPEPLPDGPFPPSLAREAVTNLAAVRARFPDTMETQTGRNLLWAQYNLAGQMCRAGRLAVCRGALDQALSLSPDDPDLRAFSAEVDRRMADGS